MSNNLLIGTIPPCLVNLPRLREFSCAYNQVGKSIPNGFGNLTDLSVLDLSYNELTGTIPNSFSTLRNLSALVLSNNHLSGTIPTGLALLTNLQNIDFSSNYFTGPIINVSAMSLLTEMNFQYNSLGGTLTGRFSANQIILNVNLMGNQISGTLPSELFAIKKLETLALSQNCLYGDLPEDICSNTVISVLALDGLGTATACQHPFFPSLSIDTYYIPSSKGITGGLPSCYLSLPALQELHLAANSISDTFSNNIVFSPSLTELDLSYNQLYGTIPFAIQCRLWNNLDVSFNRLTGTKYNIS